jgi:serine/threonine protein kinase
MNEVVAMIKFKHQNIIQLRGFWIEKTTLSIIMEFADKGTFKTIIRSGMIGFKENTIWRVLSNLAFALDYLHTLEPEPVLHRDFKPDNILGVTSADGGLTLKLADFGLSKLLTADAQGEFYASTNCGTDIYMAPEVLANEHKYDFAADIWSLGCVMAFYCNRGRHFFSSEEQVTRWRGLRTGDIKAGYSIELAFLIGRMLSPDPKDRPSAGELARECTEERMSPPQLK